MSKFLQDMPPPGGYGDIPYKKAMQTPKLTGYTKFLIFGGITAFSMYICVKQIERNLRLRYEANDAKLATWPLVKAEQDRLYLLQLRKNRDAEAELMKNEPGWEVGTYYGEPVYYNLSQRMKTPTVNEFYVHSDPRKRDNNTFMN